jgi:hypothetical protein
MRSFAGFRKEVKLFRFYANSPPAEGPGVAEPRTVSIEMVSTDEVPELMGAQHQKDGR